MKKKAQNILRDPWETRNNYIEVLLDRSPQNIERFLEAHSRVDLSKKQKVRVLKLLEMQRNAMLMFTSCGWFFDDIVSGIETTQVMQHAARAIQIAEELSGIPIEKEFLNVPRESTQQYSWSSKMGRKSMECLLNPR